jgi:2-C-methyl-D-erythritol 4-phosphate cytidylyltransferase
MSSVALLRVLIHDAARPFLTAPVIDDLLAALDSARRRHSRPAGRR